MKKRTDLAIEARELWRESAGKTTELPGVEAREESVDGFSVTRVRILDERGERELNKPVGTYVTLEFSPLRRREEDSFERAARLLGRELEELLDMKENSSVLVVGLGNSAITPDAVGPRTLEYTMVTRHLVEHMPKSFGSLRQVSAVAPGVLGTTGLESAEIVRGVTERSKPDAVIVVDALASRKLERVCSTVQLSDTGITPGSGVGNSRAAFDRKTLGVPVIALGAPTVVDAATLAADLTEKAGNPAERGALEPFGGDMIVTPREIDSDVRDISKLLGYGINFALHPGLELQDMDMFLS